LIEQAAQLQPKTCSKPQRSVVGRKKTVFEEEHCGYGRNLLAKPNKIAQATMAPYSVSAEFVTMIPFARVPSGI